MGKDENEVNPGNPRCPVCGAVDWFSDTRWDYVLHYARKGTTEPIEDERGIPYAMPVEGDVCRVCRFIRLRNTRGTLEITIRT